MLFSIDFSFAACQAQTCKPGQSFKSDCNSCSCFSFCRPENDCAVPEPVVESCKVGETTKISCYNCQCGAVCTQRGCPSQFQQIIPILKREWNICRKFQEKLRKKIKFFKIWENFIIKIICFYFERLFIFSIKQMILKKFLPREILDSWFAKKKSVKLQRFSYSGAQNIIKMKIIFFLLCTLTLTGD